ncbi:MAG: hypothetical protein BWY44_00882 [Candidatus Omnitrophica bacterium ADurb.Bin292]|nr:MAG: hypothetical protein BWY44_00882 [Candidatus Omnitrophica bacterium ADurb.Bin292]
MNSDKFADDIFVPDLCRGIFILVSNILGGVANHGVHVDLVVISQLGTRANKRPLKYPVTPAKLDSIFYGDAWPD